VLSASADAVAASADATAAKWTVMRISSPAGASMATLSMPASLGVNSQTGKVGRGL
jgi:hypothetical protein